MGNRKPVSDLDLDALLAEPIPDLDCEPIQLTMFVKRQFQGYQIVGKKCSQFQHRMGVVLLRQKAATPHGEWEDFVTATYDFSPRSARNYMRLAETATPEEASTIPPTELMQDKGIIPYRKDRQPKDDPDDTDDGLADLDTVGNVVQQVTKSARSLWHKVESLPPESYNSPERHGAFLKGFVTDIDGAIVNMLRVVGRMTELVRQANDASLSIVEDDLNRLVEILSIWIDRGLIKDPTALPDNPSWKCLPVDEEIFEEAA